MNINEKIPNLINIETDLEKINKKLYLESPELWIDFSDKINNKVIDEMVLFYATRYNYTSVLKFVVENKIINLDLPSKNKNFTSIKTHLTAVANQYNSIDVYTYLTKKSSTSETKNKYEIDNKNDSIKNKYYPIYNCPTCNKNLFEVGYKSFEEVYYNYSTENNTCEEISRQKDSKVFCGNCNEFIDNINTDILEKMCSINNCRKCGKDLTQTGIEQKIQMKLDIKSNTFISSKKTYACSSCKEELNENQIKNFNL